MPACTNNDDIEIKTTYTGEEYFRGVFFAMGDVASKLKYFDNQDALLLLPDSEVRILRDLSTKMVEAIKISDSGYFNDLSKAIRSGNMINILTQIERGAFHIYKNAEMLFPDWKTLEKQISKDIAAGDFFFEHEVSSERYDEIMERYEDILHKNLISDGHNHRQKWVGFPLACVFYVAVAIHNTVGLTFAVAIAGVFAVAVAVSDGGGDETCDDEIAPWLCDDGDINPQRPGGKKDKNSIVNSSLEFDLLIYELAHLD